MTISTSTQRHRIPPFLLAITLPSVSAWLSLHHPLGSSLLSSSKYYGVQESPSNIIQLQHPKDRRLKLKPLFVSVPDRPQNKDNFVDVDFQRIDDSPDVITTTTKRKNSKNESSKKRTRTYDDEDDDDDMIGQLDDDDTAVLDGRTDDSPFGRFKSLIDVSLETGDPKWQRTRVPFVRGNECIDCKLVFTVDLDGQSYGIAIPFDDAVAIVIQELDQSADGVGNYVVDKRMDPKANILRRDPSVTKTYNVDPDSYRDNEEYAELMEIFASKVQEEFGEDYKLRKTPKVLTISGGLGKIIENWDRQLVPKPYAVKELLKAIELPQDEEGMEKELDSFISFMREELGDEEFEKTMNEEMTDEDLELMKLFEVPGLGGNFQCYDDDDLKGLEELIDSMGKDLIDDEVVEAKKFVPDIENSSLRLFSFEFPETGKSYALVKPLQPYTLVGRLVTDVGEEETGTESTIRFELLTADEESIVFPRLEQVCLEDLKAKGLTLTGPNQ